ncbi:MAG: hypothetical protein QM817_34110 [Archangium sp.]
MAMRTSTRVLLGLTFVTPLVPLALGLASGVINYNGVCHGFMDGEWPCTFFDYVRAESVYATMILPCLLAPLAIAWLVVLILRLKAKVA